MINRDIAMVCDALDIPFQVMTGRDRHQDVADRRTACVYALYVTGRYRRSDISVALNRSHTLVCECVKRVLAWEGYPKAYARQLGYIVRAVDALKVGQNNLNDMSTKEYDRICAQIDVLEPMLERYGGKTLDNVVQGLRARIAEADKQRREMDKRQLSLFGDEDNNH